MRWGGGQVESLGGGGEGGGVNEGVFLSGGWLFLLWACPDPRSGRGLPVLQLLSDTFGESAAEQPHQEEQRHACTNHSQDVVLGR